MAKISVRIDDYLLAELRAIADRQAHDLSDVFRDALRAYLNPATPAADPVLQAMSEGIRREAASRGLTPEMVVRLWFNMIGPILPRKTEPDRDAWKLNIKADPEDPKS
jgi:predicted transcriptional regulator